MSTDCNGFVQRMIGCRSDRTARRVAGAATLCALLAIGSPAVFASDDAAADYVAERIRINMDGPHGRMVTDDFPFDYFEDVFTAAPTCVIQLPRRIGASLAMPIVMDLPGMHSGYLFGGEPMLIVAVTPGATRLWLPDPDGNAPGARVKLSSSERLHWIAAERWVAGDDGDSGYRLSRDDGALTIIAGMFDAHTLHVNPHDSPLELQSYDTQGFFTAMNVARRLCGDHVPPQLRRSDANPRANERVHNALEPAENDRILDLRAERLPIDTSAGRLAIASDRHDGLQTLTLDGEPLPISDTEVGVEAIIDLSRASYALASARCTRCGNARDSGTSLSLVRLDGVHRGEIHALDKAHIVKASLDDMQLSLDAGTVDIDIPNTGRYRIDGTPSPSTTTFSPAPIHAEIAELADQKRALHARLRAVDNGPATPLVYTGSNDTYPLTGTLHRHATDHRTVRAPERRTAAYTLALDTPRTPSGFCFGPATLTYIDVLSNDANLASSAGQRVTLYVPLNCHKSRDVNTWLPQVRVSAPKPRVAAPATPVARAPAHAPDPATATLVGAWRCTTRNPDGSRSSDTYRFNDDGSFVSRTTGTRITGRFERDGAALRLHFTRIISNGRSRALDASTGARITAGGEGSLAFVSRDASTSQLRRVACLSDDPPPR